MATTPPGYKGKPVPALYSRFTDKSGQKWQYVGKEWKKAKKPTGTTTTTTPVVAPYDRPYQTQQEKDRWAITQATNATLTPTEIEARYSAETKGAQALNTGYAEAMAAQQAANAKAMGVIQGAAGQGVGSALLTGAAASDTLAGEGAALASRAYSGGVLKDIFGRKNQALTDRAVDYKRNLSKYRDLADTKEEEKQAARLETAATNKAYDIKQQEYDRGIYESDRNYDLAVAKYEQDLKDTATGEIDDLIPTFNTIAKDSSKKKGTGPYEGEIIYTDSRDGKQKKIPVSGVNFDPSKKSVAQRDAFWKKYVEDKTGTKITGNVIRDVERGTTARPPKEVAKIMFDSAGALGLYSSAEIFQAIMRTPFGMMNAAAVREAYQGI